MFKIGLTLLARNISKIEGSLKVLSLSPPTSKKEIKSKYIELAKQLHPDVKDSSQSNLTPAQIQKRSEAFIEITKAYKFLNELSETEINNPKEDSPEYFDNSKTQSTENQSQEYSRPLTSQERVRRATNAYFNRRYRRESQEQQEQKKEPLYKQIPEFFLGCLLVAAFLIEWAYTAVKRSAANVSKAPKREEDIEIFEGMSFKKRFDEKVQ